jgi:DUF4097 and DUF4098 domain-containing protein YvlB
MSRTRAITPFLASLALAFTAADALAQQRIEENRPATAATVITISTNARAVQLIGWDQTRVQAVALVDERVESLEVSGDERALRIELRPIRGGSGRGRGDLEVRVPAGAPVQVRTMSGSVVVERITGTVDVNTMSGSVRVAGSPRSVDVATVGGSITVAAPADRIRASSTSGSITIAGPADQIRASSTSGTIIARQVTGSIEAGTVSGRVEVSTAAAIREALLNSTSGNVEFRGAVADHATLQAESHSGQVILDLPAAINAAFNINTFSGSIRSAFEHAEPASGRGPGRRLDFVAGTGAGRVTARTFSGSVRLERH